MSTGLSHEDLNAAVDQGIIDAATRDRLVLFARAKAENAGAMPEGEAFRLLTGFNDIFVSVGIVLFLGAIGYLTASSPAVILVVAASWLLAEYFTRKRRLALASIVLLIAFVVSAFTLAGAVLPEDAGSFINSARRPNVLAASLAAVLAAGLHWWRFHVPITVAAGFAAFAAAVIAAIHQADNTILMGHAALVFLPLGLAAFVLAMAFDVTDRERLTRRADTAFWLHLLAAPAIVHSALWSLRDSQLDASGAVLIVGLFCALTVVALIVDRRAILVSSLSYLIFALAQLMGGSNLADVSYGFAALAAGAIVLLMSVAWQPLRSAVLSVLPRAIAGAMPPAGQALRASPRP